MPKTQKLNVKQDPEQPIAAEIMAKAIVDISAAMHRINQTRLTRAAIVVLIQDRCKLGKYQIELVLNNLQELEKTWLKPTENQKN